MRMGDVAPEHWYILTCLKSIVVCTMKFEISVAYRNSVDLVSLYIYTHNYTMHVKCE